MVLVLNPLPSGREDIALEFRKHVHKQKLVIINYQPKQV